MGEKEKKRCSSFKYDFLEKESRHSLQDCRRSDRRRSSGQEGKLLYAERASRGYQI